MTNKEDFGIQPAASENLPEKGGYNIHEKTRFCPIDEFTSLYKHPVRCR